MTMRTMSALSLMLLVAACASVDQSSQPREEREYQTGSNIPRTAKSRQESGVGVLDADAAQRVLTGPTPTGTGRGQ